MKRLRRIIQEITIWTSDCSTLTMLKPENIGGAYDAFMSERLGLQ